MSISNQVQVEKCGKEKQLQAEEKALVNQGKSKRKIHGALSVYNVHPL